MIRLQHGRFTGMLAAVLTLPLPASSLHAQALDDSIATYAREHGFSGSIRVERAETTLYVGSFGLADRAFRVPNTPGTKFKIAPSRNCSRPCSCSNSMMKAGWI